MPTLWKAGRMSIEMEEREIDLIDLIADILSHWRGILVCMLVGAVLMGAFSYVKSVPESEEIIEEEEKAPEERIQSLEENLKEAEKVAVLSAIDDERELELYQQYMDTSVLMQMDSYDVPRIVMIFSIQMDDMGQSYILRSVYEDLINNVGMYEWLEEKTGISAVSAAELVSAQGRTGITVLNGGQETVAGSDSLRVQVIHSDAEECEKLAQAIKDYIKQQHTRLTRELGAHEITLLSESAGTMMDTGVRDRQISYANSLLSLQSGIANAIDAFTEDQSDYYELLTQKELKDNAASGEDDGEAEGAVVKPSVSKKYVLVGAVLFAFVYAGIFFVLYVLNGKLRTADELQSLYHISQLGLVVRDKEKKKVFIDKWIDSLRNRKKRQFTGEQSLQLAATAVKISAGKQGLDTVYLMGCDLKAGAEAVCRNLKELLEQENITAVILDNVLYDAAAMDELEHAKGIVLVEKAMSTMYDEISRELELASRQGIKVLGGIIVE